MTNYVDWNSHDTNGPSRSLWWDCPIIRSLETGELYGFHDDFLDYESTVTTVVNSHGTPTFEGDCTMSGTANEGGELAIFGTTDNEEASLQRGGSDSAPYGIAAASTSGYKLWFEARVKKSAITNSLGGFFVGLAGENAAVADFMADGGADFSDVDLLGFWNDETDDSVGSHVHVVTQKTSAGFDTIIDTVATLVADTYVKLGFKYDPDAPNGKKIAFFVDNTEQGTYVGEASGDATVYIQDTTNFPGGEEMSPVIAIKMASGSDMTVAIDWWRCYQVRY